MNNSKFKISGLLLTIFNIVFIISIIFVSSIVVLKPHYRELSGQFTSGGFPTWAITVGIILELFVFLIIAFITKKIDKRYLKIMSIINIIIFFILLVVFGYCLTVKPQWDFGTVYYTAMDRVQHGGKYLSSYYYDWYPNNIFMTLVLYWIYKVFYILNINFLYGSIAVNIILILISVIVTYFLIKNIYGLRTATVSSFFFLILTPLYAYAPIFYTDTFTMLCLPIVYLLYRKYLKENKWIYLILMGIVGAIGVGIKNNISIGIIALMIFAIFELRNIKKIIKLYAFVGVSFLIITSIITGICQANIPRPLDEAGLPYTHWIMMGLKGYGAWNKEDFDASISLVPNKQKIEAFNKKVIKERLDAFGVDGLMNHLLLKNEFTWGDGTYFAANVLSYDSLHSKSTLYKYTIGSENSGFLLFSQVGQGFMLLMIIIGSLGMFKDKRNVAMLFNICIFGIFLFLMLWEACPRYLLCILPIMIASASNGLNNIMKLGIFKEDKKC